MEKERNQNFELLRIISMFFIVLYHMLCHGEVINNSTNDGLKLVFTILIYITLVHVNSFVLLTGFFQSKTKFKQSKVWVLINSSLFYRIVIVILLSYLGIINLTNIQLLQETFILNLQEYWYIKIYLALYCLSPFINKLIENLDKTYYEKLLLVSFVVISIIPYLTGNKGFENNGYTLYNFIYLYLIGAYLRIYPLEKSYLFKRCSKQLFQIILIFLFFSCVILNYLIYQSSTSLLNINSIIDEVANNLIGMSKLYSNPITILQSIFFFLFFKTLTLKGKWINKISKLTIGVYLIHDNNYVREQLYNFLKINTKITSYKFILYILAMSLLVYISCSIIELIRQYIFKFIYNRKIAKKVRNKYYNFLNNINIEQIN